MGEVELQYVFEVVEDFWRIVWRSTDKEHTVERKVSHRVIFMDQGRIIEDCSKNEFFGNPDARSPRAKDFLSKILAG